MHLKKIFFFTLILFVVSCGSDSSNDTTDSDTIEEVTDLEDTSYDESISEEDLPKTKPDEDASTDVLEPKSPKSKLIVDKPSSVKTDDEDSGDISGSDSSLDIEIIKETDEKEEAKVETSIDDDDDVGGIKDESSLLELTLAQKDALIRSFKLTPKKAYLNKMVRFKVKAEGRRNWKWDFDLDEDGNWDGGRENLNAYKYTSLGLKKIRVQAKSKNFTEVFTEEIEVTFSKKYLSDIFNDLKTFAKTGNETKVDEKLQLLKSLLHTNFIIKIPDESPIKEYLNFEDIVYADLPDKDIFNSLVDYKTDRTTGLIKSITLK